MNQRQIQQMMQQAQKMQKDMEKEQSKIDSKEFSYSVGGGAINIVVLGNKKVKSIEIDEDMLSSDEKDTLQELLVSALNSVYEQIDEETSKTMGKYTQGLPF